MPAHNRALVEASESCLVQQSACSTGAVAHRPRRGVCLDAAGDSSCMTYNTSTSRFTLLILTWWMPIARQTGHPDHPPSVSARRHIPQLRCRRLCSERSPSRSVHLMLTCTGSEATRFALRATRVGPEHFIVTDTASSRRDGHGRRYISFTRQPCYVGGGGGGGGIGGCGRHALGLACPTVPPSACSGDHYRTFVGGLRAIGSR